MPYINLTDEELSVLDGKCRKETQAEVDAAKARILAVARFADLDEAAAKFIADAVREAEGSKKLVYQHIYIRDCRVCKKDAGYRKYQRSGRYHRKGDDDRNHPLYLDGIELADRSVRISGSASLGCCANCMKKIRPYLAEALSGVEAQIPEKITGHSSRFIRVDLMKCEKCGWHGSETSMRPLRAVMGGTYPGGCPSCDAENSFARTMIKRTGVAVEAVEP